jgi:hypothetical protein
VRAVVAENGLLKRTAYRPSNATVIHHRVGLMNPAQRDMAFRIAVGGINGDAQFLALSDREQARVLEISYDYLTYLRATGRAPTDSATVAKELLVARSELAIDAADPPVAAPEVRPDQGHPTSRLTAGAGRRDGIDFVELRGRPTYHDLLDPEDGYARGAQIEFFNFGLRNYGDNIGLRVEDIRPVTIVSISPRNQFFQPLSWNFDIGWARRRIADGSEPLVFDVHGGIGLARTVPDAFTSNTLIYGLIESTMQVDQRLENGYALGAGPALGMQIDLTPRWRAVGYLNVQRFFAGDTDTSWKTGLRQRFTLGTNHALRLDLSREHQENHFWNTAMIGLDWYF